MQSPNTYLFYHAPHDVIPVVDDGKHPSTAESLDASHPFPFTPTDGLASFPTQSIITPHLPSRPTNHATVNHFGVTSGAIHNGHIYAGVQHQRPQFGSGLFHDDALQVVMNEPIVTPECDAQGHHVEFQFTTPGQDNVTKPAGRSIMPFDHSDGLNSVEIEPWSTYVQQPEPCGRPAFDLESSIRPNNHRRLLFKTPPGYSDSLIRLHSNAEAHPYSSGTPSTNIFSHPQDRFQSVYGAAILEELLQTHASVVDTYARTVAPSPQPVEATNHIRNAQAQPDRLERVIAEHRPPTVARNRFSPYNAAKRSQRRLPKTHCIPRITPILPQQVAQEYNTVAPETHFPLTPSCRSKYMETISQDDSQNDSQDDSQDDNWISHRDSEQSPCRTLGASRASGSRSTEIPVLPELHRITPSLPITKYSRDVIEFWANGRKGVPLNDFLHDKISSFGLEDADIPVLCRDRPNSKVSYKTIWPGHCSTDTDTAQFHVRTAGQTRRQIATQAAKLVSKSMNIRSQILTKEGHPLQYHNIHLTEVRRISRATWVLVLAYSSYYRPRSSVSTP